VNVITGMRVRPLGLELSFNFKLDPRIATNPKSYELEQWNYKWQASYGSAQWSVKNPSTKGHDTVDISRVTLSKDGQGVFLEIPGIQPVNQIHAKLSLKTAKGETFKEEMYLTINRVPER
jgi:hypothetical protein